MSLTVSPCDFFLSSVSSFLSFVTLGLGVRAISYAKCQVLSLSEPNVRYCSVSGINDRYSSVSGQNIRYSTVSARDPHLWWFGDAIHMTHGKNGFFCDILNKR